MMFKEYPQNHQPEETPPAKEDKVVSITEAAKINQVTRQAIYVAIKLKKLKAHKNKRWEINLKDLQEYQKNKYSRTKSTFEGELVFDQKRGLFSIAQVANMLRVPAQKIYYATRVGHLPASRKGAAWVIQNQDIEKYREEYLARKQKEEQAS